MKRLLSLLSVTAAILFGSLITSRAQNLGDISFAPAVPLNIFVQGRHEVVKYLKQQIDHVDLHLEGDSVVGDNSYHFLDIGQLKTLGYKDAGAFGQLSDAIAQLEFPETVIQGRNGSYDVRLVANYWSADNKLLFSGSDYVSIWQNPDGSLTAGEVQPSTLLNTTILIKVDQLFTAAKWVPALWNQQAQDLGFYFDSDSNIYVVGSQQMLDDGFLDLADYQGNVIGWNLKNGSSISGRRIVASLGKLTSSDVVPITNPQTNITSAVAAIPMYFYRSDGITYGRYPIVELTVTNIVIQNFSVSVPVWGSTQKIMPYKVSVTPVALTGPHPAGYVVGQSFDLLPTTNGGWQLTLPFGIYDIDAEFDNLYDWLDDGNPKG